MWVYFLIVHGAAKSIHAPNLDVVAETYINLSSLPQLSTQVKTWDLVVIGNKAAFCEVSIYEAQTVLSGQRTLLCKKGLCKCYSFFYIIQTLSLKKHIFC